MSLVYYPDQRLRVISEPVLETDDIGTLIQQMIETMYDQDGIGLAAIQIGVPKRVIVMETSRLKGELHVMVNPKIIYRSIAQADIDEGCLSVPGVTETVTRSSDIVVEYYSAAREHRVQALDRLQAACIQHEVDHLDGVLFFDHISKFKRKRLLKKADTAATTRRFSGYLG